MEEDGSPRRRWLATVTQVLRRVSEAVEVSVLQQIPATRLHQAPPVGAVVDGAAQVQRAAHVC